MKSEIETLQPEAVWRHFSAICKIPRLRTFGENNAIYSGFW